MDIACEELARKWRAEGLEAGSWVEARAPLSSETSLALCQHEQSSVRWTPGYGETEAKGSGRGAR